MVSLPMVQATDNAKADKMPATTRVLAMTAGTE
jgi:hypothetical protein